MRSIALLALLPTALFAAEQPRWLPDAKMTPGHTNSAISQDNIDKNICKKGWSTKSIRPPNSYTEKLKKQQIVKYGYTDTKMHDYEEDHLISLEIGGDPKDPRNLWPEIEAGQWGARVKDRLEDKLHTLVCSKKITLETAQQAIATDWIAAYKKYVGNTARAVYHASGSRSHHHKK